jgi:hypothetical protein
MPVGTPVGWQAFSPATILVIRESHQENNMKRLALATSVAALATISGIPAAQAGERIDRGFHQVGQTMWTDLEDKAEIARFPLGSTDPSFIIYVEYFPPGTDPCSAEDAARGECTLQSLCEINVEVREDLQPIRNVPLQPDNSTVNVLWIDRAWLDGGGHANPDYMYYVQNFGRLIIAGNGEALQFVSDQVLLHSDDQCMAGIKAEYHESFKAFYNRWPR